MCLPPSHTVARQWLGKKKSLIVDRQQFCKNVAIVMNMHATIELLNALFSVWSVSYCGKYKGK
jgi:hypothetical protein